MNAPVFSAAQLVEDPLLAGLNDKQYEAVTMEDASAIILAGAGSGKTRVLTTRIAWLLREQRASSHDILAVTFTNKAAKEMKIRLQNMIHAPTGSMWIGTFHGLCNRMLRENWREAGLPSAFSIMDQDDQLAMVKRLLKETTNAPEEVKPQELQSFINKLKEVGVRPNHAQPNNMFEEFAIPFYASYEARCAREGTIDFAELMLRVTEMFATNPRFLARYQDQYSHILVDEFQDTNLMQYQWLKSIAGTTGHIFAVGDDDQSIYGFRGSNPQNMTDFVHEVANGKIIRLEQNYRSTGNILNAANSLIDNNGSRLGKNLWTSSNEGSKIKVHRFDSDIDEAESVAAALRKIVNNGADPEQMAILYRSNYQSRAYEKALMGQGVPYVLYGGTRFYERMEVKNVLAYLRLTTNLNDDSAFLRIINFPPRGIGQSTVEQISERAKCDNVSMLEAAANYEGKPAEKIEKFMELLAGLIESVGKNNLGDFIDDVIKMTGLHEQYSKKEEDQDRLANLMELVTAARRFSEESDVPGAANRPAIEILGDFLATASLESTADVGKDPESNMVVNPKAVTLMTVHASKGLEFDYVVIGGAEEGVFPSPKSIDEGNEEEERRLMYVAITRGRKHVLMTCADKRMIYGELQELSPSRFVEEIPENFKEIKQFAASRGRGYNYGFNNRQKTGKPKKAKEDDPVEREMNEFRKQGFRSQRHRI